MQENTRSNTLSFAKQEILKDKAILIIGPTGTGKSKIAKDIDDHFHQCLTIGCDISQSYKGIESITCAEPIYKNSIFIADHVLDQHIDLFTWFNQVKNTIEQYKKGPVLIVGGSSMYAFSLIDGISDIPDSNRKDDAIDIINRYGIQSAIEKIKKVCDMDHYTDTHRAIRFLNFFLTHGYCMHESWKNKIKINKEFSIINLSMNQNYHENVLSIRTKEIIKNGAMQIKKNIEYLNENIKKIIGVQEIIDYIDENESEQAFERCHEKIMHRNKKIVSMQKKWIRNKIIPKAEKLDINILNLYLD